MVISSRQFLIAFLVLFAGLSSKATSAEVFELLTVSNQRLTGQIQTWNDDAIKLLTNDGKTQSIPTGDLVWLRSLGRQPQVVNGGPLVVLANGDRLRGTVIGIDELAVRMKWSVFSQLPVAEIPFETVQAIFADVPRLADPRRRVIALGLKPYAGQDLIRLKNRDELTGVLLGMEDDKLTLDRNGKEIPVSTKDVQMVRLDDEIISFPKPKTVRVLLTLADGSWITLTRWKLIDGREITGQAACGIELTLPLADVISGRLLGGKTTWLTELSPAQFRFIPYLQTQRDLRVNRNVLDGYLQLDGREYPIGLGAISHSEVTYTISKQYRHFHARIGLDDAAEGRGMAVFRVDVDGEERFRSEPHTGKESVESLEIDVANAETLTLIIEFGPRGDVRDYANWIDPVLLP